MGFFFLARDIIVKEKGVKGVLKCAGRKLRMRCWKRES